MTPSATRASRRTWAGRDTPNPTATGPRATARTWARKCVHLAREAAAGAGHADQRDGVQEAARAGGDARTAGRGRGGRDEVDERQARLARRGLHRRALVRRQVGQDDAARAGRGEAAEPADGVAVAERLVDVGHRHERRVRPRLVDRPQQVQRAVERGPVRAGPRPRRAGGWCRRPAGRCRAARTPARPRRRRSRRGRRRGSSRRRGSRPRRTGTSATRRSRAARGERGVEAGGAGACRRSRVGAAGRSPAGRDRGGGHRSCRHRLVTAEHAEVLVAAAGEAQQDDRAVGERRAAAAHPSAGGAARRSRGPARGPG